MAYMYNIYESYTSMEEIWERRAGGHIKGVVG